MFVARVAGNVEDAYILGSLEYATKVKGAQLIVVLGHNKCGVVNETRTWGTPQVLYHLDSL